MSATQAARRLVGVQTAHPVVSCYLDLDPERFATPPARATQIRSLLDEARREVEQGPGRSHQDLQALRADLERIENYLQSDEAAFRGARALAIFCSVRDDLFDVVVLARGVESRVVVERTAYVEPLVRTGHDRRWCVALVSRRSARVLSGPADRLEERQRVEDNVHSQHDQGGWSQARYERSVDKEADDHLRRVAEMLYRRWRRERYDRLALGGPPDAVSRLEEFLHGDVRPLLAERRVDVDVANSSEDTIRAAVATLAEEDEREHERAALDRLAAGAGAAQAEAPATPARAAAGVHAALAALAERRVQTLLLAPDFDPSGGRCPACGLLGLQAGPACPADGSALEPVEHLREAMIEAALTQDAEVLGVRHYPDLGPFGGVGALLRF